MEFIHRSRFSHSHLENWLVSERTSIKCFGSIYSECSFDVRIVVSNHGAGVELIDGETIKSSSIPSLNVFEWNDNNIRYLFDWIVHICNDKELNHVNMINIVATGSWREKFQNVSNT